MEKSQTFWDKNAGRYDAFMRKDAAAYGQLYELLRPVVRRKTVLELATGTGLIAKNLVSSAKHIEATDASPEMIAEARRGKQSAKLHFSVQDMFHLPYADKSFDVVIVAPTFTHADNSLSGKVKAFFMKLAGFPLHSRWTSKEYLAFLRENGWTVRKSTVLKASFPLTYAECAKAKGL